MSDNVFLPINLQLLVFSRMFVHAQETVRSSAVFSGWVEELNTIELTDSEIIS
jgi:hypothetical protein